MEDPVITIVGAGIAGLRYAELCKKLLPRSNIYILERKPYVGGRLRTQRDRFTKNVLYEKGAWRIHSSHERFLKLVKSLGLTVKVARHSMETPESTHPEMNSAGRDLKDATYPGMSRLGAAAIRKGLENDGLDYARQVEIKTGYDGVFQAASGSRTYQIHSKNKSCKKDCYYIIQEGMQCVPEMLQKRLLQSTTTNDPPVSLVLGATVVDILVMPNGRYEVKTRQKVQSSSESTPPRFRTKNYHCDICVLAVPPRFITNWSICAKYLRSLTSCIGTLPLHHIYVRNRSNQPTKGVFDPTSNGLVISGCVPSGGPPKNAFFQFFYSCGRTAKFWNDVALSYPRKFMGAIRTLYRKWTRSTPGQTPGDLDSTADIRRHYWPHAVHFWKPSFGFPKNVSTCVRKAVQPHPKCLPNVYCIGEAYSGIQGWNEGALQTVDIAIEQLKTDVKELSVQKRRGLQRKKIDTMNIEGRDIDVSTWKHRHPGSRKLIETNLKFSGKDITELFRSVGHSDDAWKVLFHLSNH